MKIIATLLLLIITCLVAQTSLFAQKENLEKTVKKYSKTTSTNAYESLNIIMSAKVFRDASSAAQQIKKFKTNYTKSSNKEIQIIGDMVDALDDLSIKENLILMKCNRNNDLRALAYVVFVVRAVSYKNLGDTKKISEYIRLYFDTIKTCKNKDITYWRTFMSVTDAWIKGGCQGLKNLPPMIASASTFQRLADVSKADFIAYHKTIKDRPDISGLKFDKAEIGKYIKSIQNPLLQRAEHRRYSTLINRLPREHISSLFARNAFTGKIHLKKNTFNGTIVRANEHEIMTQSSSSSATKSNKWEDFKLEQFSLILEHFAKRRINTKSREGEAKHKLDAGDEYLMSSIIYLLDNQPEKAYESAVIAEQMSSKLKEKVKLNYCDSLPNEDDIKNMSVKEDENTVENKDPTANEEANKAVDRAFGGLSEGLE